MQRLAVSGGRGHFPKRTHAIGAARMLRQVQLQMLHLVEKKPVKCLTFFPMMASDP
jgi:hypothetical protein